MNKLIFNIINFSLRHRITVFFLTAIMVVIGIFSYLNTPIETFPDVTNTQIIVITQWPGRSAEEVEKFITIPLETAFNGIQKKTSLRTTSSFGLSYLRIIFDDGVDDVFARQQVLARIGNVDLPEGIKPEVEPPYGPTGEIFRYTLTSNTKSSRELFTIQNWVLDRAFKRVAGVADVNSFGGAEKSYEIAINPRILTDYSLTPLDVYSAVQKSNVNVGGDIITRNGQAYVVRGIGLLDDISDIENVIVTYKNRVPVIVRNIATVSEVGKPRLGQVNRDTKQDVVEGIVVMIKGANPTEVLAAVRKKVDEMNVQLKKEDVKLNVFYDRTNLMEFCTETVIHNLIEGILLVTFIVLIFMADWRTTLVVSIIIPLSLLFAFTMMRLRGMTANLLSMGAIDFGIIIDGAVVMVEGLFVALDHKAIQVGMQRFNKLAKLSIFRNVGAEMGKAIFFSKLIIITCLIPIFAFQKVEGKMFSPLAWTLGFALLGALLYTLTLVPAMSSFLLNKNVREKHNFFVEGINKFFTWLFDITFNNKITSLLVAVAIMVLVFFSTRYLGSEFLPALDEGALWVKTQLPMSASLEESTEVSNKMVAILNKFPEVRQTLTQIGRTNDGTDPKGFFNVEIQVDLVPKKEFRRGITEDELIDSIDVQMKKMPGIIFNYSQPIRDNVEEAVAGVPASMAVKIFGKDFNTLDTMSQKVMEILKNVQGVDDLGILQNLGQPEFRIELDQKKMAFYGINTSDAQSVIEMAIGGKAASTLYEGERKFDIRIRLPKEFRDDQSKIENLLVPSADGSQVPLKSISDISLKTGPGFIYRENNSRYIAVKFSVRGRDLGSTIKDAQAQVEAKLKKQEDYTLTWNGEFENQERALHTLAQVVPVCLIAILLILFVMFGNMGNAILVLMNVPFALIGGILALHVTQMNFSISAGIGFIALFGVCIQNGVILLSVFEKNLKARLPLNQAIREGVRSRIRAVVMTAMMAAIGLIPAAISNGIGSEAQKPLARVVIGGLVTATFLTLTILPILYAEYYKILQKRKLKIKK